MLQTLLPFSRKSAYTVQLLQSKLVGEISRKGYTVIPLKMYFNAKSLVKLEIGLAKHKKLVDKKKAIKERDIQREASRELKGFK